MQNYEKAVEEKAFKKAVMAGVIDLKEHRKLTLAEVKERLKIDILTEESI
jgi:hypothetical protein